MWFDSNSTLTPFACLACAQEWKVYVEMPLLFCLQIQMSMLYFGWPRPSLTSLAWGVLWKLLSGLSSMYWQQGNLKQRQADVCLGESQYCVTVVSHVYPGAVHP